jgi:hypothetical protein
MPPRYAYWTILIDGKATAFRARDREELLPTFNQLARKNPDIALRYFSRGKLWDSPEQAQWANRHVQPAREKRGADWRPGGKHEDPRARFKKRARVGQPSSADRKLKDRRPHERHPQARRHDERRPDEQRPQERPPRGPRRPLPRGPRKQR